MQGSLPDPLTQYQQTIKFFRDVFDSPKKTTIFFLVVAVYISVVLFGSLSIGQNLEAEKELAARKQALKNQAQEISETAKKQTIQENNSFDQTRKQDLRQIQMSLNKFKTEIGFYPANLINLIPDYLAIIPQDPKTKREYFYQASVDQKDFRLIAVLSNGEELTVTGS